MQDKTAVLQFDLTFNDDSQRSQAQLARDNIGKIDLLTTWLPLIGLLVGIVLKPADATLETPAFVLCHAAEHARKMPSDNNVFAAQGGLPMQWLVGDGGTNGENY